MRFVDEHRVRFTVELTRAEWDSLLTLVREMNDKRGDQPAVTPEDIVQNTARLHIEMLNRLAPRRLVRLTQGRTAARRGAHRGDVLD